MKETNAVATKHAVIGATIAAEVIVAFRFSIGVILAFGVVDGLNPYIGTLKGNKQDNQ